MLKRLEVYADPALLSFPIALLLLFAVTAVGDVGSEVALPVALGGALLAVWVGRILHHKTTHEPMNHDQMVKTGWTAAALTVIASLLAVQVAQIGAGWPIVWMVVAALIGVVALYLVFDAIRDLARERMHRTIDGLRLLLGAFLVVLVIATMLDPAAGAIGDMGVWVVGVSIYLIAVALGAYAVDAIASWTARRTSAHHHLPAGA